MISLVSPSCKKWLQSNFGTVIVLKGIKSDFMNGLLYLLAVVLIIGWILGFFVMNLGGLIHVLLVIAIIAILLRLIRGSNPV